MMSAPWSASSNATPSHRSVLLALARPTARADAGSGPKEVVVVFRDRVDAGRRLAEQLKGLYFGHDEIVILGLPRGGVPVAFEVAQILGSPLDVIVVRKLGLPFQPEL